MGAECGCVRGCIDEGMHSHKSTPQASDYRSPNLSRTRTPSPRHRQRPPRPNCRLPLPRTAARTRTTINSSIAPHGSDSLTAFSTQRAQDRGRIGQAWWDRLTATPSTRGRGSINRHGPSLASAAKSAAAHSTPPMTPATAVPPPCRRHRRGRPALARAAALVAVATSLTLVATAQPQVRWVRKQSAN